MWNNDAVRKSCCENVKWQVNLDHDIDIKPIAKSEELFKKWVINYLFYANVNKEGVVLYGNLF